MSIAEPTRTHIAGKNLKAALRMAERHRAKARFVFDMDSTLFCMKYRTQAIIRDCLKEPDFCRNFSEDLELIKHIHVTTRDWSVEEILTRAGLISKKALVREVRRIWQKKFFSNEYLDRDRPYKGAARFVGRISRFGAKLCYLTARNRSKMLEGAVRSLKAFGFPPPESAKLIMKEDSAQDDAVYKTEQLKRLKKSAKLLLFFENEPVILNRAARLFPKIQLFWINSTHSRRQTPPATARAIGMNYNAGF